MGDMRLLIAVLGSITFCACTALTVDAFSGSTQYSANPIVAAGLAGLGLGLVLTSFIRRT